jgi:N-acetylmuramic acid 6-phosphate etherase
MILNMISTGAMTRLGYVYGNLMVNVRPINQKLVARGATVLERATGVDRQAAEQALKSAGNSVPAALVMLEAGVSANAARRALKAAQGHVRRAIRWAATRHRS